MFANTVKGKQAMSKHDTIHRFVRVSLRQSNGNLTRHGQQSFLGEQGAKKRHRRINKKNTLGVEILFMFIVFCGEESMSETEQKSKFIPSFTA